MARIFKVPITVEGDVSVSGNLKSTQSSGDEGGQIDLTKAATNTTLTTGVTIDVYQNKLRFWETGGTNRGYFLDISAGGTGVTTNIIGTASAVSNTVTGTNSADLVYGNMADNDQFRIRVGGTATNAGFVEIATADDGTEPIYVRQYTGVFTTLARTATLLDGSGNTSFPGTVTGTTFSGSGASLTNVPAANVTGTLTSTVLGNSAHFIGTTSVALNRTSANQALTGITSITGGTGTTDLDFFTADTTSANSGAIDFITGTTTTSGTTGAIIIRSGNSAGASGSVTISTGTATATTGGSLTLSTGNASGNGGVSGAISIATGSAGSTGNSGAITMDVGTKTTGSFGTITIGGTNASAIAIGNATNTATANLISSTSINLNSPAINSNAATLALLATPTTITMGAAATTFTIAGAATTLSIGNTATAAQTVNMFTASTGASTYNFATGAVGTSTTKTLNIGTGAGTAGTTIINMGGNPAVSTSTINLNAGTINSSGTTLALFATPTTITQGAAATAVTIGASTGTLTLNNPTIATSVTSGTLALFNTGLTGTLNFAGAAGTVTIGTSTTSPTYNLGTGATASASTKTLNIGTAGLSGSTTTINIGSAVSGATSNITLSGNSTITPAAAVAATSATTAGYMGMPQNAKTASYTLVAGDAGKHIYFSGTTASQTITIPGNTLGTAPVAYQIGTTITFINLATVSVSIAISSDTMYLAGAGTTGTRTLAANGMATAVKVTATSWIISGNGLT